MAPNSCMFLVGFVCALPEQELISLSCLLCRLPDGLTRRGDINLLMLGDPGTAKSQLLKFVEKCSPIGVSVMGDWSSFLILIAC